MTLKERLVFDIVIPQGYDFVTACGLVERCLKEMRNAKPSQRTFQIGNAEFTLIRREG